MPLQFEFLCNKERNHEYLLVGKRMREIEKNSQDVKRTP